MEEWTSTASSSPLIETIVQRYSFGEDEIIRVKLRGLSVPFQVTIHIRLHIMILNSHLVGTTTKDDTMERRERCIRTSSHSGTRASSSDDNRSRCSNNLIVGKCMKFVAILTNQVANHHDAGRILFVFKNKTIYEITRTSFPAL